MTTSTWSSAIDSSSDATFRTWGSELNTKLAAIGLVQTADTGQINWSTVTRAGTNSDAGYEIWRFDDYLQTSSPTSCPVYIKIFYGTGSTSTYPRIGFQVGTGTNGAGQFTGYQNTVTTYSTTIYNPGTSSSKPSYACSSNNYFGLVHKYGGYGTVYNGCASLFVMRTNDTSGVHTANGIIVYANDNGGTRYSWIRNISPTQNSSSITSAASWSGCIVPYNSLYSSTSGTIVSPIPRVFTHWSATPEVLPMINMCTVNVTDNPPFTTFTSTLFGSTSHTYMVLAAGGQTNNTGMPWGEVGSSANYVVAMLWE